MAQYRCPVRGMQGHVRWERATATARHRLAVVLVAFAILVPPALMIAQWPSWWFWITPPLSPMTWLQSVVLLIAAVGAFSVGHLLRLVDAPGRGTWWLLGIGFCGLAIDERFTLHQQIGNRYSGPDAVSVPVLTWMGPGDLLLFFVALLGLALLPSVWRRMGDDRAARTALVVGVLLAVIAMAADSIDPSTWTQDAGRVEQSVEEIIEMASGLALLAAVWLRLLGQLGEALGPVAEPQGDRVAVLDEVGS